MLPHLWRCGNAFAVLIPDQGGTHFSSRFGRMLTSSVMMPGMIAGCDKHQILGPVVELVPVDVVNVLECFERPAEFLFHHITADVDLFAVDPHLSVTGMHL